MVPFAARYNPGPVQVIAHRGASLVEPENTMRAFRAAAADGADMVELDVWLDADGVPVVHHDATMAVDSGKTPVTSLSHREIVALRPEAPIPSLAEVLYWARNRVGVYVELKGSGTAAPVADLVQSLKMTDQVIVGSLNPLLLAQMRAQAPEIPVSVLISEPDPALLLRLGQELGTDYVHPCWERADPTPHKLLKGGIIESVREADMGLIIWQEDREEELEHLLRLSPDGICTNVPARLVSVRERCQRRDSYAM